MISAAAILFPNQHVQLMVRLIHYNLSVRSARFLAAKFNLYYGIQVSYKFP